MKKIMIIHGPNLNMLGVREPNKYGDSTLEKINLNLQHRAAELNLEIDTFQSNSESKLINIIHGCLDDVDFIIINPAGYTHSSVSMRDALLSVNIPFIEVHISNIHSREKFRHHSFFSDIAVGVITGLGMNGYLYALDAASVFVLSNTKITKR